ncbi:MAG: hypothetical protein QF541_07645 [Lentisphaeria bacterium]|jgi:hypothetical protein|nr:hypothetical protein [Lentisphaeria bacterium]
MKPTIFASLILLALVTSASAADYEVAIDGRKYLFSQGVEQEIILKDGKHISVSIEGVKTRTFQEHGISLTYPSDMKLGQESFYGIKQITLESTDSTLLMIQVFPAGVNPAGVQGDLLAGFREEFGNLGARFPAKSTAPCKRSTGGVERVGVELSWALGALAHKSEIYTMQKSGKTLAIVFQYAEEDKGKAMPRYAVITKSFK